MKLDIYLNYAGNCEEAFRFYEQHLGGRITGMTRHDEQPGRANIPADWKNAILHARIEIGKTVLMGADIPGAEPMRSAYLTLTLDSATLGAWQMLRQHCSAYTLPRNVGTASTFAWHVRSPKVLRPIGQGETPCWILASRPGRNQRIWLSLKGS